MLYPGVLPLLSMFDALFQKGASSKKKLRLFYIAFAVIFFWEILPEWMFPLLTGFSIFCLASQNNADFTRVFGGSNGNEGLGLLSICFDWQYIAGSYNPFTIPLQAQFSNLVGYILCMVVFCGSVESLSYITTSAVITDNTSVTKYHEFGASGYFSICL